MGLNFCDVDNDGFLDFYLGSGNPPYASALPNIKAVLEYAAPGKLVFGTDVPFGGDGHFIREILDDLPHNGLTAAQAVGVRYGNAEMLFPRLKQA